MAVEKPNLTVLHINGLDVSSNSRYCSTCSCKISYNYGEFDESCDFLKFGVGVGVGFVGGRSIASNNSSKLLDKIIAQSHAGYSSNTYYSETQNSHIELPALTEDLSCDACGWWRINWNFYCLKVS